MFGTMQLQRCRRFTHFLLCNTMVSDASRKSGDIICSGDCRDGMWRVGGLQVARNPITVEPRTTFDTAL